MQFETQADQGGVDHVKAFLDELDTVIAKKVLTKLEHLSQCTYAQLMRSRHLKKVEGVLYELRVPIGGDTFRFLGSIGEDVLWMVHAIKKKTQKLKRKDIDLALRRINN